MKAFSLCVPRNVPRLRAAAAAALVAVLLLSGGPITTAAASNNPEIKVIFDSSGHKLQVDGRDFMVFGMNWGYIPIGQNYMYNLWAQPDEMIEAALDYEMSLLKAMGVNAIRQYAGIPPRWVRYIYERYGIFTILNHPMARYGFTIDGVWVPMVDYSDPRLRELVTAEIVALVDEFRGVPGVLMWLLGNENNYGLSWSSFEIEALPEGERDAARARYLYSLFEEVAAKVKEHDPGRPVAIANGDVQYIDIIAEECKSLDVFGTNCYRGISARDLFQVVQNKLNLPVMFTEFGSDAFNAREMREDQVMQARYLIGQWEEIYEQSYGKGRVGNAIGGVIFQWSDGWWKFGQEERLDIHDTNASWPNGGYTEDYVEGENNMNEEWWGITAKGHPDHRGRYELYPRAAYYALRDAFKLAPYAPGTDLEKIRSHFATLQPAWALLQARGNRAGNIAEITDRVRLSGLRLEFETYHTGGKNVSTPDDAAPGSKWPAFRGFDRMESFYADFTAQPSGNVTGTLSLNILGNVPENRIDEIFYENRGRSFTIYSENQTLELADIERVKVYRASVSWDDRWFRLDGFYRTGHYHWGYEGDFFGLYRDAFYGENVDIYNGEAPVGFEIAGKKWFDGLKLAFGPQLWWGANPSMMLKYGRDIGTVRATLVSQYDFADQLNVSSSFAIPIPPTRKLSLQLATTYGPFDIEVGGILAGANKVDDEFEVFEESAGGYTILQDYVKKEDALGVKGKVSMIHGRYYWYAQSAYMGIVADGGPTATITFTGWNLKDSGMGNQTNFITGLAVNLGKFQVAPNFLWQKPLVPPMPNDVPLPGGKRNVRDDPFAVLANREMVAGELMITYDPTPATWMWAWDNDIREDARFAASLGYVYRDLRSEKDGALFIAEDGSTIYAFTQSTPPRALWEINGRVVSRLNANTRIVGNIYLGTGEPNGDDLRRIDRYGALFRIATGPTTLIAGAKFNDWGPYDYHRDFNLTYPVQLIGDLSHSLGTPKWFDFPQTRLGVHATWRSLDHWSPRYCPSLVLDANDQLVCDPDPLGPNGNEWEIRTYLHVSM